MDNKHFPDRIAAVKWLRDTYGLSLGDGVHIVKALNFVGDGPPAPHVINSDLRDHFAGQALPVVMQKSDMQSGLEWGEWLARVTNASYEIADAMLKAREAK